MPSSDMVGGLELLATVERQSALLRGLDRPPGRPRLHGTWAVQPDWRRDEAIAMGGAPARTPPDERRGADGLLPAVRADAVFLGRPSSGLLRVRAFYVGAGLTLAVHGREPLARSSRLLAGASVLERVRGRGDLVLPRVVERGRRLRHSWVVEELLPGRRFSSTEWASAVPELAEALTSVWLSGPVATVATCRAVSRDVIRSFAALLESDKRLAAAPEDLYGRVSSLADCRRHLLVGWCHGDPVHGNWLRLPDGRAALVDWELARRRPLGHDAMKLLVGFADPRRVVDAVAPRLEASGGRSAVAWRMQIAASLVVWLSAWSQDRAIADRTDRLPDYRRRLAQRLELLDALTA